MDENIKAQSHDPISRLVFELSKLPGVGEKTATRLAYHILKQGPDYARSLSDAIASAKAKTSLCKKCFTFTDQDLCKICNNSNRDTSLLCLVERPSDLHAVEQAGSFRGLYHVLHGVLSPLDGIGPEDLKIRELLDRVKLGEVKEIIIATNPSIEGEATAIYLSKLLKPLSLKLTRLAYGIPMGAMLEYTDRQTIGRAIENRVELQNP